MSRLILIAWVALLAVGCQVISGEADREFSETACEGVDCYAECSGGDCPCVTGACDFRCTAPPCAVDCGDGIAGCRLDCGTVTPDTSDCRIEDCEDDDEQLCANGTTLTCRTSCP